MTKPLFNAFFFSGYFQIDQLFGDVTGTQENGDGPVSFKVCVLHYIAISILKLKSDSMLTIS